MNQKYLIPSETRLFQEEALAIALHEVDEAVWRRQSPKWLERLSKSLSAQNSIAAGATKGGSDPEAQKAMIRQMTGKQRT